MSREQGGSGSGSFYPWRAGTGAPSPQGQGSWRRGQASGSGVPQQGSRSTINQGQGRASGPQRYDRHSSGNQSYQHSVPQQAGHHQRRYQVENERHRLQAQAATSNHLRSAGDVGTQSRRNDSAGPSYQAQPATHPGPSRDGNYDFSRQVPPAPYNYGPQQLVAWTQQQQVAWTQQLAWQRLQQVQQFSPLVIQQFMDTRVVAPYIAGVPTPQETTYRSSQGQQLLNMQWPMSNPQLPANSGIPASGTSFTQRPTLVSGTEAPETSDGPAASERPTFFKEKYAATCPPRPVRDSNITRRSLSQMPKPPALDENIQVFDIEDDSDDAADSASMSIASAKANEDNRESGNVLETEETITLENAINQIAKADEISADIIYHPKAETAMREAESKIFIPQFNDGCTIVVADSRCDISIPDDLAHHQKQAEECSNEKSGTEAAATVTEASNNRDSVVQEDPVALVSYADSYCEDPTTIAQTTSSGNMQQVGIGNFVQLEQDGGETDSEKEDYQVSGFTTSLSDEFESTLEGNETVASTTEEHVSIVQCATEVRDEDINTGEFVEKQNPVIYISASEENVADPVPGCSKVISASVGVHEQVEDESYAEDLNEGTILQTDRASNSDATETNFEPVDEGMEGSVDPSVVEETVSRVPPFVDTGLVQVRAKELVSAAFIGLCRKGNYQVPSLPRLMTLKRDCARRATRHPRQDQRSVLVPFVRSLVDTSREEVRKAKICFIGPGYLRSFLAGLFTAFFNQGPENVYLRNSENLKEFLDLNDKVEDDRFQVGKFVYLIDCDKPVKPMEMNQTITDLTLLTGRIKFRAQLLVVFCRSKCNTSMQNFQSMKDLCQIQRQFSVETRNLFKDDPTYVKAFLKILKKSLEMNVLGITQEIFKEEFRRAIQPQL